MSSDGGFMSGEVPGGNSDDEVDCSIRVRVRGDARGGRWIRRPRAKEGNKHSVRCNRDGWETNEMALQGRTEVLLQLAFQQRNLYCSLRSLPLLGNVGYR